MAKKRKQQLTPLENFIFTGSAAILSKTVAAPMETAKLLKQLSPTLSETEDLPIYLANPSRITLLFLYHLFKNQGIFAFFSGNQYNILRYFPTQILNFAFKGRIRQMLRVPRNASYARKLASNILSGGLAGCISLAMVYPLDAYRTLYAIDVNGKYKSGEKKISISQLYSGTSPIYSISCTNSTRASK